MRLRAFGQQDKEPRDFSVALSQVERANDVHEFRDEPGLALLRFRDRFQKAGYTVDMQVPHRIASRRVKRRIVPATDFEPVNVDRHYDFTNGEIDRNAKNWGVVVSIGEVREAVDKTLVVYDEDLPVDQGYDDGVVDEVILTDEQQVLFDAFKVLKPGAVIVSKTGVKARVLNVTDTKITVLFQDKEGLLRAKCLDRFEDFYTRRFDWIERFE